MATRPIFLLNGEAQLDFQLCSLNSAEFPSLAPLPGPWQIGAQLQLSPGERNRDGDQSG